MKKEVTAHCTQEIADWLDPKGTLRKAGLLIADMPVKQPNPSRAGIERSV